MSGTRNVLGGLLSIDTFPLQRFSRSEPWQIRSGWLKIFSLLLLKVGRASLKQHPVATNCGVLWISNNIQYTPSCYINMGQTDFGLWTYIWLSSYLPGFFSQGCQRIIIEYHYFSDYDNTFHKPKPDLSVQALQYLKNSNSNIIFQYLGQNISKN